MDWLILTVFSVVSRSIYGVMSKVLSNEADVSPYTQSVLLPISAGTIVLFYAFLSGGIHFDLSGVNLLALVLMACSQGVGNIFSFVSLKNLTNSTAQISFSSILIFNTLLSIVFFQLRLNWVHVFGIFLLMAAIIGVVLDGKVQLHKKGVAFMLVSALLFSVFQLTSAELSKQMGTVVYLLFAYFGAGGVVYIWKWRDIHKDFKSSKNIVKMFYVPVVTAIPSLGYFIFSYFAYYNAPEPGKVAMLLTSQVVLTVLLSHFIFKEKSHLFRKVVASVLVFVAAILIKS